jgi:hypothetical protein
MRLLRPDEATFRRMYEALNRDPNFRLLVALQGLADCESASNIDPSPNRQNHLIRKQFIEISGGHAWTPVAPEEI